MIVVCAARAVLGRAIQRSMNTQSITKTGVGSYTITLVKRMTDAGIGVDLTSPERADGIVLCTVSGAFKADADFASATTIAVQILSLLGAAADPPNGTVIKLIALQ